MRTRYALVIGLYAGCCAVAVSAEIGMARFYVAQDGRNSNPGTAEKPFATPARARDAVRDEIASGLKGNVTVFLRGGTYFLDDPVVFGPEDSGTDDYAITYAAWDTRPPVLSGGRPIHDWKRGTGKLWSASLPEVGDEKWYFRELFVNGRRAVRARTPNRSAEEYCWRLTAAEISRDLQTHTVTVGPGKIGKWSRLEDVEVIALKNWATLHKKIQEVNPATGLVVLRPPHVKYFGGNRPRKGGGCFFENAPEMLDEPGEWYLDRRTRVLTYWPLDGEDMTKAEVIAPILTHVLEIAGTADRPVRNLHFRGLSVMHSHVPLPAEGHHGRQAAFRYGGDGTMGSLPCAIRWVHARHCRLIANRVAHVGGGGVDLREGCRHNRIEGNEVFDAAGNGINVGGPNDEELVPSGNRIANNYVHHCGAVYYGSCAIWAGLARKTEITHNLVCEHPYTGISIGWNWSPSPSVAREFTVTHNHVHDVMKEVCDGGAIYSLGYQPGTVLRANHLHDVHRSRYAVAAPNNGIFFDEGSKGYLVEDNVIYGTAGRPVRHNRNKPEWHTWKNNLLVGEMKSSEKHVQQTDAVPAGGRPVDLTRVKKAGLEPEWQKRLIESRR
ncbi:MAG: right-handed parallel beta-helix repeat-containing protein [Kiritimatiellia bacterium]|jgi:hypothetical protein|nr:right-handed parallel beta-helix repeat-containing protein [Kiritimatiellia bacterium]